MCAYSRICLSVSYKNCMYSYPKVQKLQGVQIEQLAKCQATHVGLSWPFWKPCAHTTEAAFRQSLRQMVVVPQEGVVTCNFV